MIDILSYWKQGRKTKTTPSGWVSGNAPCCGDKRGRGGIKVTEQGWSYSCFNCSFTASFILGRTLSLKARKFLKLIHVDEGEIERLNLESLRHRSIEGIIDSRKTFEALADIKFEEADLPPSVEILTPEHEPYWTYVRNRCVPEDYPIMVQVENDGIHWTRPHVVVPFTHNNTIVGYSCRFLDNRQPKYINDTQPGYVFGTDLQQPNWQYAIVVEGVFDALSINGLAVLHQTINDNQARLIRSLGKEVIVVPDQDRAGLEFIDRALELNWAVSIPEWPEGVKDVNDAVIRLGKLGTLLTIMQARETNKIKIELRRKQLVKRIQH